MSKQLKKFNPNLFTQHYSYGKSFFMLSLDLLKHPAYLALSDKQRLILMHLLAYLSSEASKRPDDLLQEGFSYTWKMCGEDCSENTFSEAMKEFLRIGWIEHNLGVQNILDWQRNVYRISKKWRSYTLNDEEFGDQQKKKSYKANRLQKKKKSKSEFIMKFFTPND